MEQTQDLCLGQFTGTEQYYKGYMGVNYTDGVQYLAGMGVSWLITDICAVVKVEPKVKTESFVSIKCLKKDKNKAVVFYTDGNENVLFKQEYEYTDLWDKTDSTEISLFYTDNVLMLANEY